MSRNASRTWTPGSATRSSFSSSISSRSRRSFSDSAIGTVCTRPSLSNAPRAVSVLYVLAHPKRHEARDERDEEDLPEERLEHRERLREADRRGEVAETERRQRNEAEVEELGLLVLARQREERVAEAVHRQVQEREQEPHEHVGAERAEDGLVRHPPVLEHARQRDGQRRRHEQGDR